MKNLNNICFCKRNGVYEQRDLSDFSAEKNVQNGESLELLFLIFNNELNLKVNLLDKGTSCDIKTVYLVTEKENCRIKIDINHAVPETTSKQTIKGILTDEARAQFNGIIRMPRDSQRCVGEQNHRAFVLSDKARVEAIPELEIYADDVQCSHGSAVGPLENQQVFYLTARGISEQVAKRMLLEAFVCDELPESALNSVREWLDTYIR